jgi:hypothetical protein
MVNDPTLKKISTLAPSLVQDPVTAFGELGDIKEDFREFLVVATAIVMHFHQLFFRGKSPVVILSRQC